MNINNSPYDAFNLDSEVANAKGIELSHGNMQFKTNTNGVITPYQTIIGRFHNILTPYIIDYTLSDNDYRKYYQKPKLLCSDLYGTPELWSGILYINNMVSVANFTKQKIKIFNQGILSAIEEIMTIYRDDIDSNKAEVYKEE